jgi:hypothetical protein
MSDAEGDGGAGGVETGAETGAEAGRDGDRSAGREETPDAATDGGRRDVVVPMRLYKTVTVFSTLGAVVTVVVGFILLDAATGTGGILRVLAGLVLVGGAGVDVGAVEGWFRALRPVFAALGLGSIGFGAGVYILGSRFRAEGMGNAQDDADEPSHDG